MQVVVGGPEMAMLVGMVGPVALAVTTVERRGSQ